MSKSYKLKDDNYIDSSAIMHEGSILEEVLNQGLLKELLNSHSANSPWNIDMSSYSYGILVVMYKPDRTTSHNSYIYSFVSDGSGVTLNRIAYTEYNSNAAPTISASGTTLNISKATYGGNIEVFFLGK